MHPGELNKNRNWSAYHLGLQKLLLINQRVYFLAVISTFKATSCTSNTKEMAKRMSAISATL